jgi:predicted ATPase
VGARRTRPPFLRRIALERERVPSFDTYPFVLPGVRHLETLALHPEITYLVGDNGSGKSTLLEAIAVAFGFNPEGGSKSLRFETRPSHSSLHSFLKLEKGVAPRDGYFFRAESWYGLATALEEADEGSGQILRSYGGISLHEQSHGESFVALFFDRIRGPGLYLLDEPEAALSPTTQLAVLARIQELTRNGSQFVVATHSPILLASPECLIYRLTEGGIDTIPWEEADCVAVTRRFLADPGDMLRRVVEDAES